MSIDVLTNNFLVITSSTFSLILSFIILIYLTNLLQLSSLRVVFILLWHYFFVMIAYYYSFHFVADSSSYYEEAVVGNILINQTFAVKAIVYLNIILTKYLGFSYIGVYFFYGYVGLIGILFLDSSLNYYFNNENKENFIIRNFIIFMPSLHFWSSHIGKDTLAIFAICFFIWLLLYKKNILYCLIPLILFYLIRPQHSFVLYFSILFTLSIFLKNKYKIPLFSLILIFSFLNISSIINISGVGLNYDKNLLFFLDPNFYSTLDFLIVTRQNLHDYHGSGFVILTNMNFPSHIFTYLFRPLPFEAKSIFRFVASIENLLIMLFFSYSLFYFRTFRIFDKKHYLFIFFFIFALIPLSFFSANFGISARQKWIILIPIILVCCKIIQTKNLKKNTLN